MRSRMFESFAVVSDKSYKKFLKAELSISAAVGDVAKLWGIARASQHVGSLFQCPDCGRFLFAKPGGRAEALFLKEDKA